MKRHRLGLGMLVFAAVLCSSLLLLAGTAAAQPADDVPVDDVLVEPLPESFAEYLADGEAEYQEWLAGEPVARARVRAARRRGARGLDAPYAMLSTVSHKQLRNDWCGPATMAILDHFLRGASTHWTQQKWSSYSYDVSRNGAIEDAERLWTDARGAYPPMMAVGLKNVTGKGYACFYFPSVSKTTWLDHLRNKTQYAELVRKRPVAYSARIEQDKWTLYRYYHAGHIMGGRGFDWRKSGFPIYVDDPYPENAAPPLGRGSSGGATYGKHTYSAAKVAGTMYYIVY